MKNLLLTPESDVAGWNAQADAIKAGTFVETPHDLPLGAPSTIEAPAGGVSSLEAPQGTNPDVKPDLLTLHASLVADLAALVEKYKL